MWQAEGKDRTTNLAILADFYREFELTGEPYKLLLVDQAILAVKRRAEHL